MFLAGPSKLLFACALGAATTLTACLPAPPPKAAQPPAAAPVAPDVPTTTVFTSAPVASGCGAGVAGLASVASSSVVGSASLDATEAAAEASKAQAAAANDAALIGDQASVPLTITTLDANGVPSIKVINATNSADAANKAAAATNRTERAGGDVLAVEPQREIKIDSNDPYRGVQWGLDKLDVEPQWSSSTGAGQCVAVIDTGIYSAHPDLAGRVAASWDITGDGPEDGHGHGTHVAGIIAANAGDGIGVAGMAPGATLLSIKVLRNNGSGTDAWTAAGIAWAVSHGAKIINLSLGSTCPPNTTSCTSVAMQAALDFAKANDVIVVAAAGNDGKGSNNWSWPAAYDYPIAVASTDQYNNRSDFSTYAPYVDVAAPGTSIASSYKDGGWVYMSGTSMATPHVAALAALARSRFPGENAAQIRDRIVNRTIDLGSPGLDDQFGTGLINPAATLG